MKNLLFVILIWMLASHCRAVSTGPEYTFKRIEVTDGLTSNYVIDIEQDGLGYVWIATESGLNRFDGRNITIYNTRNSDLKSNELTSILSCNENHTLWIGTKRDGIFVFDCLAQQFIAHYTTKSGLLSDEIAHLSRASDGGVWITHRYRGIDHYILSSQTFTHYEAGIIKGLKEGFFCTCDDGKGNLFVGYSDHGMAIIDIKKKTCRNFSHDAKEAESIPGNSVQCIYTDKDGNVWVGTDRGLALFTQPKEKFINFRHDADNPNSILSDRVSDIGQSTDGRLWVCTHMGGVSILDMQENVFTSRENIQFHNIKVTNDTHGVSSPNASCFLQDSFGNIWIGNYRGGADFLSYAQPAFRTLEYITLKDGKLRNKQVWGIAVDNEGQIWLGGENEVAVFQNSKLKKIISLNKQTNSNTHVSTIYKDKSNTLWFGLYRDGVLTCNPSTQTVTRVPLDETDVEACCFYEQGESIWIGTQNGIFTVRNGKARKEDKINALLKSQMVHGLLFDQAGRLWVGTFGKGIQVINTEQTTLLHHIDTRNGLSSDAVNGLFQDSKGGIWAATRNGVSYIADPLHPENIKTYADNEKTANPNVRAITEDLRGEIWISTNGGIAHWNSSEQRFYNYTYRQNVPVGDFMDGSVCKDSEGNLYFGSQNGVCWFNPANVAESTADIPVQITEIKSYGTQSDNENKEKIVPLTDKKITLSYDWNTFRIIFNVLDYTQSMQAEYAYTMQGLGNTWFETHEENQVTFRNLPPGEYVFKVKAKLNNQPWGEKFTSVKIVIIPPLYLTWYAKLGYFLICIGIIVLIFRFYRRKLTLENRLNLEHHRHESEQKLNNERLRFYTNITHELRTPLTLILGPLEDLQADKTLSPKQANKIGIIRDSATRLLNLINQILEFRKTETENRKLKVGRENVANLIQEIGIKYKELNRNPEVTINIRTNAENQVIYCDREILTVILDNLMSNALKYTPKGSITLSLSAAEENGNRYTLFSVEDTGHGIDAESLNHIFERYYQGSGKYQVSGSGIGLALVKSLTDLHEGFIEVESEPDKGSKFTLKILTDNTYPNAEHRSTIQTETAEQDADATTEKEENRSIILVVEDNHDIREYIRSSFENTYEVLTANNGQEGWELAQNRIPNIIISDIMMPVMDGIELCKHIKEDIRTSHIPVILLTAKDTLNDKEEGYAAGADSFITKPFSARLLNSRINNILENRRKIAGLITSTPVTETERKNVENERRTLSKLDQEFLDKVTNIIEENLSLEKIDVGFIADKMCMSHSTLYRKIKGLTNISANEFVRKIKMRRSIELLDSGEYTITEVSDQTGFATVAYFRQCFKDEFGMTPTDYMKRPKTQQPKHDKENSSRH